MLCARCIGALVWFALLLPVAAAQAKVQVATRPGTWTFAGQTTLEIHSRLYHGADYHTFLKVRWPQDGAEPPRHHRSEVASDAFGNKEHWCVLWRAGDATVWIARGHQRRNWKLPKLSSLQKVELADPSAVRRTLVQERGANGFVPADIATALARHMTVPAANAGKPDVHVEAAKRDYVFDLLCRVRCVGDDGRPLAGVAVRFPVVIPGEQQRSAGTAPTNSGLPTSVATSGDDGYAVALVAVSELAYEHGAQVAPTPGRDRVLGNPSRLSKLRRLPRVEVAAERVRDQQRARVAVQAGRKLRGTLVDAGGRPIVGATVAVAAAANDDAPRFPSLRRTDEAGRFAFDDLPDQGDVQLVVRRGRQCASLAEPFAPEDALQLRWQARGGRAAATLTRVSGR
ncbi:MAG: carboxypeptidase regulatory-like domain-containing protein [Planctomycetota bacterium]